MFDEQKEIGSILIEISNRNVDRFFSLIEFAVVVLALYASITIYNPSILKSFQTFNRNLILCIISIFIAIYYSLTQIQDSWEDVSVFTKNEGLIQFKKEQELSKLNDHLFSSIKTQSDTFISSLLLIVCSLGFSFSYLLPKDNFPIKDMVFFVFCVFFIISIICKHREKILTLYKSRENNINS
jgi:hypothetical protein